MRSAACTRGLAVLAALALHSLAAAALWQTEDGLAVTLADSSGQVTRLALGGESLSLAPGVSGGLSYQEYTVDPAAPRRLLLKVDAEGDETTWSSASFADWQATGDFVRRATGTAAQGDAYLQIGDGTSVGVGMATRDAVKLTPGDLCTLSWSARTHDTGLSYILCLRYLDADGKDVSANAPTSKGWTYSPYSQALYRSDLTNTKPDTWERFSTDFEVPEGVSALRVSLRVYRGGSLRADLDDLTLTARPSGWSAEVPVRGPVQVTPEGLVQDAQLPSAGLRFTTRFQGGSDRLSATVEVSALGDSPRPRCLRLHYRLPLDLHGWTWSANPLGDGLVEAGHRYEDSVGLAGHPLSRYPLACVSHGTAALALATPTDVPALQSFRADAAGFSTLADFGLSPQAPHALARFTLCLYRCDPAWTFRSALERYYKLFPQLTQGHTDLGGAWTLRMVDPGAAKPEDFGLRFYECGALAPQTRQFCRDHGIATFVYAEPWGRRQVFRGLASRADMPPYAERLAAVQQWAQQAGDPTRWGPAPRSEVAQAVLNSMITGPDGLGAHFVDLYSDWAQWWQLSTDPKLPEPSGASICLKYEIEPAVQWADGIYLDSVVAAMSDLEDYAPTHLAVSELPLSFSLVTGRPVVLSGMAHYAFMRNLADDLHRRGKLLMMNLFAPVTRLYGHLADVAGCELGGLQDRDSALQQRLAAYHRPVSNLLQWRWAVLQRVPAMTSAEMEDYLANQLSYGFWPGISTAGGGTAEGYAGMHRYLQAPELLTRDKPLFARYLPLFDALNRAGWEPVPHVRASDTSIAVERFGQGPETLLTVYNPTGKDLEVTLSLDADWWGRQSAPRRLVAFESKLSKSLISVTEHQNNLTYTVRLLARRTEVLSPVWE
ncbi:hypothetical protein LLH03_06605 [bacterium]|nr:hypothetical protein [bacterium]